MKRPAYMIGIAAAAVLLAGCGSKEKAADQAPAAVQPKEAVSTRNEEERNTEKVQNTAETEQNTTPGEQNTAETEQNTASEKQNTAPGAQNPAETGISAEGLITEEEAREIAFKDAEVAEADVSGVRVRLDVDDGVYEYEVEFYAGNLEYDYDIDAATGKIVSMDRDIENDFQITEGSSGQIISEEEAKQTALAKVPQATEQDVRIHLDQDDGRRIYEGSIYAGGVEYEFEIDAASGVILEWEEDD